VQLAMLLKSGMVSPQFHVQFDDFFKSTKCKGYKVPSQGKADETTGMQNSRLG